MATVEIGPSGGRLHRSGQGHPRSINSGSALVFVVAVAGLAVIFSRRPDAFIHPQFWAEDGSDFFGNAYDRGALANLLHQHAGYLTVFNRLVALVAVHLPLAWAPASFTVAGAAAQVLPALILVSDRAAVLIRRRWLRVLAAALYLALPNTAEIDINLVNAQWHLAMAAFLILVTRTAPAKRILAFDSAIVLLCGLTGPFGLLLPLIAAPLSLMRRRGREHLLLALSLVAAVSQVICLLATPRPRPALGATWNLGTRILGGQVVLGPVLGQRGYGDLLRHTSSALPYIVGSVVGAVFLVVVMVLGIGELRLLLGASLLVLVGSLLDPVVTTNAWASLAAPGAGARYFFLPVAIGLAVLIGMLERVPRLLAGVGTLYLAAVVCVGVPLDWRYPAYKNFDWSHYARVLESAPRGTTVVIPTNPPGWKVDLIRR